MKKQQEEQKAKIVEEVEQETREKSYLLPDLTLVPREGIILAALGMQDGLKKYPRDDWKKYQLDETFVNDKLNHALHHLLRFSECGYNKDLTHALADLCIVAATKYPL